MIFQQIKNRVQDWLRGTSPLLGGAGRSSKWPTVRKVFLAENPNCSACGGKGTFLKPNEIHHCIPYHISPDLELMSENLLTVCREHHFFVCHLNSWKSYNEKVREDAKIWRDKIINRP